MIVKPENIISANKFIQYVVQSTGITGPEVLPLHNFDGWKPVLDKTLIFNNLMFSFNGKLGQDRVSTIWNN